MKSVIEISGRVKKTYKQIAEFVALETLRLMHQPDGVEIAITFVNEKQIKQINNDFRNINKVTDVLSFPSTNLKAGEIFDLNSEEALLLKNECGLVHFGDIALCTKKMTMQAKEFNNTPIAELKKLIIHSMLHLMGYDHIKDEDYIIMNEKERFLDEQIKF